MSSRKISKTVNASVAACALGERPLISDDVAGRLQAVFKVLANEGRLKLIHALERAGELSVTELAETVAMTTQACSNQLQRLVDQGILAARRDGNHVHYRIVDPCVTGLLDLALCLTEETRRRTTAR